MRNKLFALVGALFALFHLTSCVEIESKITVAKDGSGTVEEELTFSKQVFAMMQMGGGEEDPFAAYSEETLKDKATKMGEGVEFVSVEKKAADDDSGFIMKYKFADITKLKYSGSSMAQDAGGAVEVDEKAMVKFAMEGNTLKMMVPDPAENETLGADQEIDEAQMEQMAPMLAGMKMKMILVASDEIAASNATHRDGDTITLTSMNFDELMKNEGGLGVLNKMNGASREEVATIASETQGLDVETQEVVTVTFK